jgi:disulfide bond formation protein DsbB
MHAPAKITARAPWPFRTAVAVLVIAAATIAGAWAFQLAGYPPCDLCLKQRLAYYVGVPLAAVVAALAARAGPRAAVAAGRAQLVLLFAANAALGVYHVGVEWKLWQGPTDCTGPVGTQSMRDFLQSLDKIKVVRCDAPALRVFGISLAGWNAVISAFLAAVAAVGLARTRRAA